MRFWFFIGLLLILSCKGQEKANAVNLDNGNHVLELLLQDAYFPIDSPASMVIKDDKALNSFFARVNRTRKPGIPVPKVDFSQRMLVVVCSGAVKGERFPVVKISKSTDKEIVISIKNSEERNSKGLTTYPFSIYEMNKSAKEIFFQM